MENTDKGLTVPKWVLINRPKIPQMPQNLLTQIVCPSPKVWDFDEKRLHWTSLVRGRGVHTVHSFTMSNYRQNNRQPRMRSLRLYMAVGIKKIQNL
jgi:hypothetical protein